MAGIRAEWAPGALDPSIIARAANGSVIPPDAGGMREGSRLERVTRALWVCVGLLVAASVLSHVGDRVWAGSRVAGSARLILDVDDERNLPTWFASFLLMLIAMNLWLIGEAWRGAGGRREWRWSMLAFAALAMSAEEIVCIHERLMGPLRTMLGTGGPLYYAWVIPAMGLVVVVGILSVRLVLGLAREHRDRLLLGGAVYLCGAIGFEMIGGAFAPAEGVARSPLYLAITTAEETLELVGLVIAFGAVMRVREGLIDARRPGGEAGRPAEFIARPEGGASRLAG